VFPEMKRHLLQNSSLIDIQLIFNQKTSVWTEGSIFSDDNNRGKQKEQKSGKGRSEVLLNLDQVSTS
jgi:hypothetical protein